jgi:hypothetical protein
LAYQIAFDLYENATQQFIGKIDNALKKVNVIYQKLAIFFEFEEKSTTTEISSTTAIDIDDLSDES